MRFGSTAVLLALLVGTLLRAYPMHRPYLGLELQELYPRNAVTAVARGNWEPVALHHGAAVLSVLRALFTGWYGIGRLTGRYADRVDLLASFLRNSFPFVLVGRALVLCCALATIYLVARLGTALWGELAGGVGALFLAVSFIHIRESHHVWLDVPAGAAATLAVLACLDAARAGTARASALAGAAAALTLASRHSTFAIALPVLLGVWWGAGTRIGLALRRLLLAGSAAFATYALLSPYGILKFRETATLLGVLRTGLFGDPGASLDLVTLLRLGIGADVAALALLGLVYAWRREQLDREHDVGRAPRKTAIVAAFPLAYLLILALGSLVYARYLAVLAPFMALFAGNGAVALVRMLRPARIALPLGAFALAVAVPAATRAIGYDRFLALRDTRQLAADWIHEHVPPGTHITVPNAVPYPNPVLPIDLFELRLGYPDLLPALQARGIADRTRNYPMRYLAFFATPVAGWEPRDRFVVTAEHPVIQPGYSATPEQLAALAARGARAVAHFDGFTEPIPARVRFEPAEFDYVPLAGFDGLIRPGPNLTIWQLPEARP
jgi:hypothetical protein